MTTTLTPSLPLPTPTQNTQLLTRFVIPERFHYLMPVWTVFYLAWLIPPEYGIAQMIGQCIHWYVFLPSPSLSRFFALSFSLTLFSVSPL